MLAYLYVEHLLQAIHWERRLDDGNNRWEVTEPLGKNLPPGLYDHQLA